jgi:acetoin utilization deacetylase AcuC-like enzyme
MSLVLVTADLFADHVTPPGHPERPERAEAMQAVALRWERSGGRVVPPRAATDEELAAVHHAGYIEAMRGIRGRAAMLDEDTFTSPESETVARAAAGAVVVGVEHVLSASAQENAAGDDPGARRAFVLVRPPGHHAEADKAMGFCLYNNIAVGAAAARAKGITRIAIVDYDVHHGNGTQAMFFHDPSVLFISSHQYPFYPGTGAADEIGAGEGTGFTVNLPMESGATDADYDLVYREAVLPVLAAYRPQLLMVSAGFDAHERDPLAGMRMTADGYNRLTARLIAAADELSEGRIIFVTEGGYDTSALAECCQGVIDLAAASTPGRPQDAAGDTRRGQETLQAFRASRVRG